MWADSGCGHTPDRSHLDNTSRRSIVSQLVGFTAHNEAWHGGGLPSYDFRYYACPAHCGLCVATLLTGVTMVTSRGRSIVPQPVGLSTQNEAWCGGGLPPHDFRYCALSARVIGGGGAR